MIGRGRSFRSNRISPVINREASFLQVYAETKNSGIQSKIGIRRSRKETLVKVDGSVVRKMSDMALRTPIQIMTPKSHEMLERGPEYRRRFVEWGVFHVEHSYRVLHSRFIRALEQRNAALKKSNECLTYWDKEYVKAAEEVESMRLAYFLNFQAMFELERKEYGLDDVNLNWRRGWKKELNLSEALKAGFLGDRKMGFTHSGPHRADLDISLSGNKAINILSRGQQKLLVAALNSVQAKLVIEQIGQTPIILMDDLASELDDANRSLILGKLIEQGCQCFITGTNLIRDQERTEDKVFHVEHGELS